tara:strand:+ start:2254 stop:3933 length:1680 start_codon:yes stop_codon:yes gene_type:complete
MSHDDIDQAQSISNMILLIIKELRRDGTLSGKEARATYAKLKNHLWENKGKYISLLSVLTYIDFVPRFNQWLGKRLFKEVLLNVLRDINVLAYFKDGKDNDKRREKGDDVSQGLITDAKDSKMDGTSKEKSKETSKETSKVIPTVIKKATEAKEERKKETSFEDFRDDPDAKYDEIRDDIPYLNGFPQVHLLGPEAHDEIYDSLIEGITDEDMMQNDEMVEWDERSDASNTDFNDQQDELLVERWRMFEQGEVDRDGNDLYGRGLPQRIKDHFSRNKGKYAGALATVGALGIDKLIKGMALQQNDLINQQAYSHFTHRGYGLKEHFQKHKKKYLASSALLYAMNKRAMDHAMENPLSLDNYSGEGLKEHFQKHKKKYIAGSAFLGYKMLNREGHDNILSIQDIAKDLELGDNWIQLGRDLKNTQDGQGLKEHFQKHKAKYVAGVAGVGAIGLNSILRNRGDNYYTPPNTPSIYHEVEEYPVPVPNKEDRLITKHMRILRNNPNNEESIRHLHHLLGGKGLWGDLWGGVKPFIHQAIKYFVPSFNPPDAQGHKYLIDYQV